MEKQAGSFGANLTNYVLITPVKNEESMLPDMAESIIHQTKLPVFWIIIDGNSSDRTFEIAENLAKSHQWITIIKQETFSNKGGHSNFSIAVREAYQRLKDLNEKNIINFKFIGKLDIDQIVPQNFFEYLIEMCKENPMLGVVSGKQYSHQDYVSYKNENLRKYILKPDFFPKDELPDKRLYRKEALEDIGGFPIAKYSPDTVVLAKLRLKGWRIKTFPEISIINLRKDTGIERDRWSSSIQFGKSRYYLGYHPLLLMMSCAYAVRSHNVVKALGLFFGYMVSWAKDEERIPDEEVLEYFRYKRIKEIFKQHFYFSLAFSILAND